MTTDSQWARKIADLERRIAAMERAAQLPSSSVKVDGVTVPVATGIAAGMSAGTVSQEALTAAQDAYTAAHNIGPDQLADDAVVFGKIAAGAVGAQSIRADALIGKLIATDTAGARVELKPDAATNTVFFYTGRLDEAYPAGITAFNGNGGLRLTAAGIGTPPPGESVLAARLDIGVDPADATRRLIEAADTHALNVLVDENLLLQGGGTESGDGGHISIGKPRSNGLNYARGVHVSGNVTLDPNFGGAPGYGGANKVHVLGDLETQTLAFSGGGRKITAQGWGRTAITANSSGAATITHDLGAAPVMVLVKPEGTQAYDVISGSYTDTTFTVTALGRSSGAVVPNVSLSICWVALR